MWAEWQLWSVKELELGLACEGVLINVLFCARTTAAAFDLCI